MRQFNSSRLLVIAAAASLSACAMGPDFRTPQGAMPERWRAANEQLSTDRVDDQWWKQFGDPVLDDLIDRAVENNADVKVATLRLAESRVQRSVTTAGRLPNVNASGMYERQRQSENGASTRTIDLIAPPAQRDEIVSALSEPFDIYQVGFDVAWELDLWGRVRRSVESADASLQAGGEDLHDAQLSLVAEVARTYMELRGVREQLRIANMDVEASTDLVQLTTYRVKGGVVDELDLSTQRARLADARSGIPMLRQRETQTMSTLALLLNVEPGALDERLQGSQTFTLPQTIAGSVPSEVARRRPDIRRAEARLHAATADIGVAVADLYPRISLTGGLAQQSLDASDLTAWGSRQWSIGPSISLPIFDGARRRSVVEIRKLQQQEAAVNYQRTVLRAWHEIENALSAYGAQRERNQELAAALASSRAAYDIAHVRYSHGLVNYLVELDAHRTLLQVQRSYADSTTEMGTRLISIYKALGGGWSNL